MNTTDWKHIHDLHGDPLCRGAMSRAFATPSTTCPMCKALAKRIPDDALPDNAPMPFEALDPRDADEAAGTDARQ